MRDLSKEEYGEVDSETERGSVWEEGEQKLNELTTEFLRSQDLNSPDPNLVGRLYIATFQYIARHFEKRLNDREFAEDATQEAFKALQKHFQTHHALPEFPMAFLLTAARNWLLVRARNQARRSAVSLENVNSSTLDALFAPDAESREPFEAVASAEIKGIAFKALDELDERTHKVIELRRQGKEWAEIGAILKISDEVARKTFKAAVHHVQGALGAHFSSFVTTADGEVRKWITTRRSAEQAIDLLPPPHAENLQLLLIKKMSERELAEYRKTSLEAVKQDHARAVELFQKKYRMTEDELLDVLWHGE